MISLLIGELQDFTMISICLVLYNSHDFIFVLIKIDKGNVNFGLKMS